jgi:hypothetical protein
MESGHKHEVAQSSRGLRVYCLFVYGLKKNGEERKECDIWTSVDVEKGVLCVTV